MAELLIGRTVNYKLNANPSGTSAAGTTGKPSQPAKDNRTVIGFCSVFGNQDAISDVVVPGAFKKSVADFNAGASRCRFLWNHDQKSPPCASIEMIAEVGRADLPAAMRASSDVTGALKVVRRYFTDDFSDRVFQGVLSGGIREMSFAFNVLDYEFTVVGGQKVRLLKSVELLDCSDVLWGCNSASMANVSKNVHVLSHQKILDLRLQKLKTDERRELVAQFKFSSKHPNFCNTDRTAKVLERARELVRGWS